MNKLNVYQGKEGEWTFVPYHRARLRISCPQDSAGIVDEIVALTLTQPGFIGNSSAIL